MMFSVVTVTLNAGDKLIETVTSVMKQADKDWELIVKDGFSTDQSIDRLPMDSRIRLVKKKDRGIYDAMNQAVKEAKGDYIIFLNCGDFFYDTQVLCHIRKKIEKIPDRGIYYGNAYFRLAGEVINMPGEITAFTCFRHIPCHQACIFSRKLFENDEFNLKYKIRADYDFFLRKFFKEGIRPCDLGITVADYEGGGYSESKVNRKRDKREHNEILHSYMHPIRIFWYKAIMVISLQPLRKYLSQKSRFAGIYDKIKRRIYRKS